MHPSEAFTQIFAIISYPYASVNRKYQHFSAEKTQIFLPLQSQCAVTGEPLFHFVLDKNKKACYNGIRNTDWRDYMFKKNPAKFAALIMAVICLFSLASCGSQPTEKPEKETKSETLPQTQTDETEQTSSETSGETKPSETQPEAGKSVLKKIAGGADEVGIYSVVVRLNDQAADKGVVEMVYRGAKGSPQENSIVNTFRIEYEREAAGTFEIKTFFDGEVYQNYYHKDEVNVTNTFGATLRAGDVVITYTPDGGEPQEVFRADADYFRGEAK